MNIRTEIRVRGLVVGCVKARPYGLWVALVYGKPYQPPMFGQKGLAMDYVRQYGQPKETTVE